MGHTLSLFVTYIHPREAHAWCALFTIIKLTINQDGDFRFGRCMFQSMMKANLSLCDLDFRGEEKQFLTLYECRGLRCLLILAEYKVFFA